MKPQELLEKLHAGAFDARIAEVYGEEKLAESRARIASVTEGFLARFEGAQARDVVIFSAPGRTELGGNHTDHQGGCVLAGSVDMDTLACAAKNDSTIIRVHSKGHAPAEVDAADASIHPEETGNSPALVRGVACRIRSLGYDAGGFDAYTETQVLRGSGLSSSAAFEVLLAEIENEFFCGGALDATALAQIGQYAENVYYGKPCGLMDQMACATGGVIAIDFANAQTPAVRRCAVDFAREGRTLVIIDSGASHANLDAEYAAIPADMCAAARLFGAERLRDVDEATFLRARPRVAAQCGERAALRAEHFFAESRRALAQYEALEGGDFEEYLALVRASGQSSEEKLQNVSIDRPDGDRLLKVIRLARELAGRKGAARVHGGGFAGTVQAIVPNDRLERFIAGMEAFSGKGSCHLVRIRDAGSIRLLP